VSISALATRPETSSIRGLCQKDHLADRQLILETRMGDKGSFGILVTRYRSRALRVAASMVGDIETARDLTPDAFIKAYRSLGKFDLTAPFLPWFYQILKNLCRDHLRRRTRFTKIVERIKPKGRPENYAFEQMQRDDIAMHVREAVNKLKPSDRRIIELKHFAGLSYDEIADILNIPKGTVMSRLFYARKALRAILEDSLETIEGIHNEL